MPKQLSFEWDENPKQPATHTPVTPSTSIIYQHEGGLPENNGEFCYVERKFSESGTFSFSGNEKIESIDDVAYIFRELENSSIENAFAVLVNKGYPTVIHLGMGTSCATQVNIAAIKAAYDTIGAEQLYFVHNHPSGEVKCSTQDKHTLHTIYNMFPENVVQEGIIINTISGYYGTFNILGDTNQYERPAAGNEIPLTLHSFDRLVFSPDYNFKNLSVIHNSMDVAALVSAQRLGSTKKISYLILDRANKVIGNIHTIFQQIEDHETALAEEITSKVILFGGNQAILYGDFDFLGIMKLKNEVIRISGNSVRLTDVISINGLHTKSAIDEMVMEATADYNKNDDIRYRFIGEKGAANLDKAEEATTRLDNLGVAREMEKSGKDAKAIKLATGWERGADGKWRYEMQDFGIDASGLARKGRLWSKLPWGEEFDRLSEKLLDGKELTEYENTKFDELSEKADEMRKSYEDSDVRYLDDYVKDNDLFVAYPELKQMRVELYSDPKSNTGATYYESQNLIRVNEQALGTEDLRNILVHEVQHAIQASEGFPRGGNESTYRKHLDSLKEKHDAWSMIDEFSRKSDELGQDVTQIDVYNALRDEYLSERFKFGDGFIPSRDAFDKGFNLWVRGYDNEGYEDAYNEYQYLAGKYGFGLDNNKYRELSGEVEARNVQSRMNMTPEKRQNSLASETENVARENQIFLNGALRGVSAFMDTSIEEVSRRFNEELNAFERGKMRSSDSFDLGLPSSNLRSAGVQDKPIYMKQSVLREHLKKHKISISEIKDLPKALQHPMMVYEWGSKAKSLVVVTEVSTNDGRKVSVAIKLERNGERLDVNEIASVHGKEVERFLSDMANAKKGGLKEALRYAQKSKVLEWFAMAPPKGASQTVQGLSTATNIIESFENQTLLDGEILSAIDELSDELGVKVNKVKNRNDLPEGIQRQMKNGRYPGLFDPKTGEVYMVMDEITNVSDAQATMLHEIIGHKGIRGLFGDKIGEFTSRVLDSMPKSEREKWVRKYNGNEQLAAEEYVARFAEGYENPSMWEKIKAIFRDLFRNLGIDLKIKDSDLKYILWKAKKTLEKGNAPLKKKPVLFRKESNAIENVNQRFNEELDAFEKGEQKDDLHLGMPGNVLLASGLNDTEMYITSKTLKDHFKKHGLKVGDIKNLPSALRNPFLVYEWGDKAKSLVVITNIEHGDERITAAIKLERNGKRLEVNELASVHPKDNRRFINDMLKEGKHNIENSLRYVSDKKKALDWLGLVPPKGTASLTKQELDIANVIKDFENPTLLEGEISSAIDRLSDELGVPVNRVKSRKDLPEGIQRQMKNGRYSGLFDPKTGEVYMVMDEITDVSDAQATMLHEIIGHKGIRGLFCDKMGEFTNRVLDSMPENERSKWVKKYHGNEQLAEEEYVARFAKGYENPNVWEKIKAAIRDLLRDLGIDLKLGDNDLKYILWKAKVCLIHLCAI